MKKWLLLLALAQVVPAEEFFARNRPFKAVEKRQGVWTAALADLARALEMPLTQAGQGWVLGPVGEDAPSEPGVYFQGKKLQCVDAEMRVPVQAFVQEVGGRFIENKSMGSVDLYVPTRMLARAVRSTSADRSSWRAASALPCSATASDKVPTSDWVLSVLVVSCCRASPVAC